MRWTKKESRASRTRLFFDSYLPVVPAVRMVLFLQFNDQMRLRRIPLKHLFQVVDESRAVLVEVIEDVDDPLLRFSFRKEVQLSPVKLLQQLFVLPFARPIGFLPFGPGYEYSAY